MKANKTRRTITEEQYLLAEEKGISRNTFRIRISRGWGFKKAIETPITKTRINKYWEESNKINLGGINDFK